MRYEIDKNTGFFVLGYGYGSNPTFSSLTISGATTVGGQLTVNNNAAINGNLTVSGSFAAAGLSDSAARNARAARQGLVFDGTGKATATLASALGTSPASLNFVLDVPSSIPVQQYVASIYSTGASPYNDLFIYVASGTLFADFRYGAAPDHVITLATNFVSRFGGKKITLTIVWDGSTCVSYINGIQENSASLVSPDLTSATTFVLGGSTGPTNLWSGGILASSIYNRALSASEVVSLFEAGVPSGADYNSASNTALNTSTLVNGNSSGVYLYDTFSGASATGFTAVKTQTSTEADAYTGNTFSVAVGQQFLVTFNCTLTSGLLPYLYLSDWAGSPLYNSASRITAGSFSRVITATASGTGVRLRFYNSLADQASYAISNLSITRLGLLLAPDAAQAGGGTTWYDTSGNAANITLPASGVSWNVPTSGRGIFADGTNAAPSISFINDSDSGFYSSAGNEIGIAVGGVKVGILAKSASNLRLYGGTNLNYLGLGSAGDISLVAAGTNKSITLTPSGTGNVIQDVGNLLIGTTTDAGQKLQVAGNLYANNSSATHTVAQFSQSNASYNCDLNLAHVSAASSALISRRASGELWMYTTGADAIKCYTNSALALTLDSSQNATFAGNILMAGSKGVALGAQTNPAVQGIYASGNNTNINANSSGAVNIGTASNGQLVTIDSNGVIKSQGGTAITPASASATGTAGMIQWDASYIYVCTAANTWKRAAIATW